MKESALYIHIPFCDHKCIYCDFYSIITSENINPFLKSLNQEAKYYYTHCSHDRFFSSIFFGGGTPSLMEPEYIGAIIGLLKENYKISGDAEITLETNPGTVSKEKLKLFLKHGINRISIGVQSFNEDELKFLTRIHNKNTAIETVYNASEVGFKNISVDLIFNLPGQSKQKWIQNLETAMDLPITHISTYSLILERGTILNKMVLDGRITLQDEDYDAELYEITMDFLEQYNFRQYEVSNFCKSGFECMHNNAYWGYKDYLGLGPSSHSFINGKRWWNFSSLKRYISEVNLKGNAKANYEIITDEQKLNEYIMLALRSKGLDLVELKKLFGEHWINKKYEYLKKLLNANLIIMNEETIRLTKKGYAVCDEILGNIL